MNPAYPRHGGKTVLMQKMIDAELDNGKTVAIMSTTGDAKVMRRRKHLTLTTFYPNKKDQAK